MIDKLKEKGLDLHKETHPNKKYFIHAEECRRLANELMKIYNFPEKFIRFATLFSELHDVGKLMKTWNLNQSKRPKHAIEGAEWLLENIDLEHSLRDLLAYAVMTHHSPLYAPQKVRIERRKYSKCRDLLNNLNSLIIKMDKRERFDLADTIGICKLADIASAMGLYPNEVLEQYKWPDIEKKIIRKIDEKARIKVGKFDKSRFEKQREIASCEEKSLLVAAPTGWGKTSLSLIRMEKVRPAKIFYILPTITAIKEFYDDFRGLFGEKYVGEYFYFADVELLEQRAEKTEENLVDIYRYFIPKVTITTVDQMLLTMLQVGKYHIRRFNFRNSLMIFDEFHLLTPQMIAALRFFLRNLEHYNVSCLFMSATPSPVYIEAIEKAVDKLKVFILSDEYKRLKRHKIELFDKKIEDLISERTELLENKTLIIVNTVGKAQKIYKQLKEDFGNSKKVLLIHGDFAYKDRAEKEKEVSKADILVSTQVAEVSLDVSFEILITELAPIPSLVQRFGRVNRYGSKADKTNVFICEAESEKPYGKALMNFARENLEFLVENLEKKSEYAYLDEKFWEYEQSYMNDIERTEDRISEKLENIMLNFYSLDKEDEILKFLGRELTWLAVPEIYLKDVLHLRELSKEDRSRRKEIKKYFAPISRNRIAYWDEDLGIPVIKNYDKDLGIFRESRD